MLFRLSSNELYICECGIGRNDNWEAKVILLFTFKQKRLDYGKKERCFQKKAFVVYTAKTFKN
jgi:hypothetical protein